MIALGVAGAVDWYHDAAAALVVDDHVVAFAEEERFNRVKHTRGLPLQAIEFCLRTAGISFEDVDHVGYYLQPDVLEQTMRTHGPPLWRDDFISRLDRVRDVPAALARAFPAATRAQFHFINHHRAHAASAFHVSGFEEAAILTVDGAGDWETCAVWHGRGNCIEKFADVMTYPHSLGLLYSMFAAHLGLGNFDVGPGKLMGLAGYGTPRPALFEGILVLGDEITVDPGLYHWGARSVFLSAEARERFGPPRPPDAPFEQRHYDIAATVQDALERSLLHIVHTRLPAATRNLCMAGGVALNVCANRRISASVDRLFVQPAAGDAGTALGCALDLCARLSPKRPAQFSFDVYCGPDVQGMDIEEALRSADVQWTRLDEEALCARAAACLQGGGIVGWAQGRMECGPRALGNRSILMSPADPAAKDELNRRVKHREPFRPYAPSVLAEHCADWMDVAESPHMLLEATVRPEKRSRVPGIVHVDGTTRPQTVTREANPRYHRLLRAFEALTGLPMLLNTSFNRHGEPIVNTPREALAVLLETDMDALYFGDYEVRKR